MTIQRQYSLPNCKLILEGLSTDNAADPASAARPVVSVITNVECHLVGHEKPLTGGREFLESLVKTVNVYAQDFLSGIPHTVRHDREQHGTVQLRPVEKNLHRLSIHAPTNGQSDDGVTPMEVNLTTVQLFDLVEAIDQLLADAQTLPELSLSLSPLPKRYIVSQEPVAKRAVPAALGISSLAAAAVALFFVPIPEVRRPEPAAEGSTQQETPASPTSASPGGVNSAAAVSPNASPDAESSSVSETNAAVASRNNTSRNNSSGNNTANSSSNRNNSSGNNAANSSSSPADPDTRSSSASPSPDDLEAILETSGNISDPNELDRLTAELQGELYDGWEEKPAPTFTEPLEYRVGVDEDGQVVGYKFVNDPALDYLEEIPLSDIQLPSTAPSEATSTSSIAQFLVIFRPDGVLEISPWYGLPPDVDSESSSEE